jgi:glyoxylate/hydroxypyruvate reductase A
LKIGPILVYHPDEVHAYASLVRAPRDTPVRPSSTPGEAGPFLRETEVLYAWAFPPHLLAAAPRLRWIQVMGAGVDRFLVAALPAEVRITRAPVFGAWMVEYVFGWSMWVTQKMETFREAQRTQRWIATTPERLRGKTLTIVGLGEIGRALAAAATTLGMRVIGVSRSGRKIGDVNRTYRVKDLPTALAQADFAVLAIPLTTETRGLVGERELEAMKASAWLVNIARGPVVQEGPLVEALQTRRIAGAILDVFDDEPLPRDHPLWRLPNVVVTPHISGPSTPAEITPIFNENLRRYAASRPLIHAVNRRRGY